MAAGPCPADSSTVGRVAVLLSVFAALAGASNASAAQLIDRNATNVRIATNAKGEMLLTYAKGAQTKHILVWGAINALPPSNGGQQVKFKLDYSGGWGTKRKLVWKTFANACGAYDGPELHWLVTACKAPDGSYWALQAWRRLLPMRGFVPWLPDQGKLEFHVSHWSGPLAVLEVSQNWTYGGRWQGIFGRLTYRGTPVHGFRTPSATRRDPYARFVYIDAHDSVYGPGWRHDTAIVTHVGDGAFCYSFVPQVPPPGYPDRRPRGPAIGDEHRVTVMGPGVTPDVQWVGPPLGAYDAARDSTYNALFGCLVGPNDRVCTNER